MLLNPIAVAVLLLAWCLQPAVWCLLPTAAASGKALLLMAAESGW
jgi:hypothetical protein